MRSVTRVQQSTRVQRSNLHGRRRCDETGMFCRVGVRCVNRELAVILSTVFRSVESETNHFFQCAPLANSIYGHSRLHT